MIHMVERWLFLCDDASGEIFWNLSVLSQWLSQEILLCKFPGVYYVILQENVNFWNKIICDWIKNIGFQVSIEYLTQTL